MLTVIWRIIWTNGGEQKQCTSNNEPQSLSLVHVILIDILILQVWKAASVSQKPVVLALTEDF